VIISLRAGSRLFINGAVLKADRKVNLHLLNDATFLLESHVMQPRDASSPLRQIYFAMQVALMNPAEQENSRAAARAMLHGLTEAFDNETVLAGLKQVRAHLDADCLLDALKALRNLFALEDAILQRSPGRPGEITGETHDGNSARNGHGRLGGFGKRENQRRGNGQL
jgi:flagellar biosynthesis repressor protein FlbT